MGSGASKAARSGAARQYPTRAPGAAAQTVGQTARRATAPPTVGSVPQNEAPQADSIDPDYMPGGFSKRLNDMGVVTPNPTFSPSSRAGGPPLEHVDMPAGPMFPPSRRNPTLSVLESRRALQKLADEDLEDMNRLGNKAARRFMDTRTLVDALELMGRGQNPRDVERRFGLKEGLLDKLGKSNVVEHIAR